MGIWVLENCWDILIHPVFRYGYLVGSCKYGEGALVRLLHKYQSFLSLVFVCLFFKTIRICSEPIMTV